MFKSTNSTSTAKDQGFVSIVITMILMIVLTLIVLGFAQLSRREQRNALDQHLSTQAFYAAESGANDFKNYLQANPGGVPPLNQCNQLSSTGLPNQISTNPDVAYTCILYDTSVAILKYDTVTADQATFVPITNSLAGDSLLFNWNGTSASPTYRASAPGPGQFPPQSGWGANTTSILRVMIIPFTAGQKRQDYINNAFTAYLYPSAIGPATAAYASGTGNNSGVFISGDCLSAATPPGCNATITGLPAADRYYIVMRSIYNSTTNTHVEIRARTGGGAPVGLKGAQVVIDVTGRAEDVLRRVEIRQPISLTCGSFCPVGFTSMQAICKQMKIDIANHLIIKTLPDCTFNFPP